MAAALKIDPEFRALIPPLKPVEREQLEANLVANGCRDPLVVWRGILIDGHNRHEICGRRGIPFHTVEVALESREHVLLWIEENQLGRRNLTDDQRAGIALRIMQRRAAVSRAEQARAVGKLGGRGKKQTHEADATSRVSDRTRVAVSKQAQVSERRLRSVVEIEKKRPEAVAEIVAGTKSIAEVKTEIRREERMARIEAMEAPPPLLSDRRYPVVYADPPWRYEFAESDNRAIENQYPTMELCDICSLPVPKLAAEDALLFLWVPNPKLVEGLDVMKAWGFEYRTAMVWVKPSIGVGYFVRNMHEFLLIGRRGNIPVPLPADRPGSVIQAARGEHSVKPVEFYVVIERMYPTLAKVELFARSAREGWDRWGNQANRGKDAGATTS
jgi:N6-adenosine-specific RNA methylase IME4